MRASPKAGPPIKKEVQLVTEVMGWPLVIDQPHPHILALGIGIEQFPDMAYTKPPGG